MQLRRAERYVGNEDFIVHAGDVTILSKSKHPSFTINRYSKKKSRCQGNLYLCKKIKDFKRYGVPTIR